MAIIRKLNKPKQVIVTVTNEKTSQLWTLCPYNRPEGVEGAPEYWVPTYKMTITGPVPAFKVIRFGLQRKNLDPPPAERPCDAGLFKENVFYPVWLPTYRVHSGPGSIPGAWQLYRSFLIHEGSPDPDAGWGTLGCIEVVGKNEWHRFLNAIQRLAGASLDQVGRHKTLKVKIQAASSPKAKLKTAQNNLEMPPLVEIPR